MKKLTALLLALLLAVSLIACGNEVVTENPTNTPESTETVTDVKDDVTVRVAGMTGPTSIGMVKVISDSKNGESEGKYEFTIAGSADEITPKIIKNELDIAAVPANLASNLYHKTDKGVKLIAINNLGVLYVLDKNTGIKSVADLKGKTIYATGKGSTPEYTLKYILTENGINPDTDVTIEFKSEPAEIVSILKEAENGVAMLPMPYVIVAKTQVEGLETALDLGAEWKKLDPDSETVTGVIIARSEFIDEHPEAVKTFIDEYVESCKYVNENVEAAATLVEEAGIFKAAIAKQAIPFCNVTGTTGDEMKPIVEGYLNVLLTQNPNAIGGSLPGEDFYYAAK